MTALSAEIRPLEQYRAKRAAPQPGLARATTPVEAVESLRRSAMLADADASDEMNLALLWDNLTAGVCSIVDAFFSQERHYLIVSGASAPPVGGRRLAILEAVLSGTRQKNIAIDMDLAPSTVALNARLALQGLGVAGKPSRAHPLLMLAARASRESVTALASRSHLVARDGCVLTVVAACRPDAFLADVLPAAELRVIRSLVEGDSYAEIANSRGTSTRTIANQITSVFRRLKLSGRNELVQQLFERRARGLPQLERLLTEALTPPALGEVAGSEALHASRRSA